MLMFILTVLFIDLSNISQIPSPFSLNFGKIVFAVIHETIDKKNLYDKRESYTFAFVSHHLQLFLLSGRRFFVTRYFTVAPAIYCTVIEPHTKTAH